MVVRKKLLVLVFFQGLLQGHSSQMNFPSTIVGLIGSCVEIPCTYYPYSNSRTPPIVWHVYLNKMSYPIFNSQGSSPILSSYKNRTSLIPGNYSCTLKIDPVRREDETMYIPGMGEMPWSDAWTRNGMYSLLRVTDNPGEPVLHEPYGPGLIDNGLPAAFICSVQHTCGSSPPSLKWNKPGQTQRQSVDLFRGKWDEILTLRYIPSYRDDSTEIKCTATYPNGRITEKMEMLYVKYAPKNVRVRLTGSKDVTEGSNISLTCSCKSNPPPLRYEWYTGESKRNLQLETFRIRIENVTRDTGPITCAAINVYGKGKSQPMKIPVVYRKPGEEFHRTKNIIYATLFPVLGFICLITLTLLIYFYWRNKARKTSSSNENSQHPDATYTDLVIKEISHEYDIVKPAQSTAEQRDFTSVNYYENLQSK